MKLNLSKLFITVCVLISGEALAETQQIPKDRKITEIRAYRQGVFVNFTPAFPFEQGCPNGGNVSIAIETDQELYTAVLAAASQNLNVGFGVNGCFMDRPKAYRIDIQYPSD